MTPIRTHSGALPRVIDVPVDHGVRWDVQIEMLTLEDRTQLSTAAASLTEAEFTRFLFNLMARKINQISSPDCHRDDGKPFLSGDLEERRAVLELDYPFGLEFIDAVFAGYQEEIKSRRDALMGKSPSSALGSDRASAVSNGTETSESQMELVGSPANAPCSETPD